MKKWIHASQDPYKVEVVPECNDDDDNPCCWSVEFYDDNNGKHFVWITKYDDNEYIVEDSQGNNLAKELTYRTFTGAKKKAFEVIRYQLARDFYSN